MAKTKRQYILATAVLSGAAAILSFVALGTQEWVSSKAIMIDDPDENTLNFGLFAGNFHQKSIKESHTSLTVICRFDLNVCALLCGDNMGDNLEKLYNRKEDDNTEADMRQCEFQTTRSRTFMQGFNVRADGNATNSTTDRIFINSGVWLSTIIFLILSAIMGLFSAILAVWNTATSPYQVYFSVFGLYIYNAISFCSILLSIILWGAMFAHDLLTNDIPCYKTFIEDFSTKDRAHLGYSYWILLVSLFFYLASICLLYLRNYLISKEPEVNVHIEDTADPAIYLY